MSDKVFVDTNIIVYCFDSLFVVCLFCGLGCFPFDDSSRTLFDFQ